MPGNLPPNGEMNDALSEAQWSIDRFVRRFEPNYIFLARYASMPVVLTPELLNCLRTEFLRGKVPWIAEADLLLSDLCRPVGYEQYVLQPHMRNLLLQELQAEHPEVLEAVAVKLIGYFNYLTKTNRYFTERERKPQAWAAMVYIAQRRQEVADEIAAEFERVGTDLGEVELSGTARQEMERLAKIVRELAPKLNDYPSLLAYAELVSRTLKQPQTVAPEEWQQSYTIGDRILPALHQFIPQQLLPQQSSQQFLSTESIPSSRIDSPEFPPLQTFEFEVVEFETDEIPVGANGIRPPAPANGIPLEPDPTTELPATELQRIPHQFEVATIVFTQKPRRKPQLVIKRQPKQGWQYIERLDETLTLALVKIPAGTFLMGAPEEEPESLSSERPQHEVSVSEFYMGKYPVTQAQWRFVAAQLPQVNRELEIDPSRFKGDNLPVETISWLDAEEFCQRLSRHTGRLYRLPSEAEWEYACRAGTTTPFHFGETINAEVANYRAQDWKLGDTINPGKYDRGRDGEYRQKATSVGSFPANNFGLHDIHGNVWEWCADDWHNNYQNAPSDGSIWLNSDEDSSDKMLRGGSWYYFPRNCRSAYRFRFDADFRSFYIGFRVVCAFPREDSS